MNDLKPCPFCGGEPFGHAIEPHEHSQPLKAILPDLPDHKGSYVIECKCAAGYLRDTKEECEAAWNQRPPVAGLAELTDAKLVAMHEVMRKASKQYAQTPHEIETWESEHDAFVAKAAREFLGKVDG